MYKIRILLSSSLTVILLSACLAQESAAPTPAAPTMRVATALPATLSSIGGAPQNPLTTPPEGIITREQSGTTLHLAVGESRILELPAGYEWRFEFSQPGILSLTPKEPSATPSSLVWILEAQNPGQTSLTASGDPLCRKSKPACMMPSLSFEITILVE